MRKKLKSWLSCPNCNATAFSFFAYELHRNHQPVFNASDESIADEDDIKSGVSVCSNCKTAFPIHEFIGVFLSNSDADKGVHLIMLESSMNQAPEPIRDCINETIGKIYHSDETADGQWNREEMRYYDAAVDTQEKSQQMLADMKSVPVWRILFRASDGLSIR